MKCPFCDSVYEVEQFESGKDWKKDEEKQWEDPNLRTYICESCGGEVIGDATLGASACPYCGNPVVMKEQFAGILKPDYVLPFQIDKKQAMEVFKTTLGKKRLLSRAFKAENHIQEIKGLYVPVWLFDSHVQGESSYNATKVRTWSDSKYNYTETSYYDLVRGGHMDFEHIPEDGSQKMDDTLMESIGPFDFSQAVDFQSAYLSGYLADRYDVESQEMLPRVHEITKGSLENKFEETIIGYATQTLLSSETTNVDKEPKYALYPVWLLTTKWKDQTFLFGVNGQTGKFAGKLPLDKGLFWAWFAGLTAAIALPLFGLMALIF